MEEAQDEVMMNPNFDNCKDQQPHVKGKRTKRLRPQSPAAASSAEEDEEMANCLNLLALCQSRESPKRARYDHGISKLNSMGKISGCYVYECKTCSRTFPSFQALGGHRASHKKPKAAMMNDERSFKSQQKLQQLLVSNSDEEDANFRFVSSLISLPLSNNNNNMKSNKVHECSICGAGFTSGQALGGHMRRHRAAPAATTTNKTLSLNPMAVEVEEPRKSRNNMLSLELDLNLPAPEYDMRESKLPFSSKQQRKPSPL